MSLSEKLSSPNANIFEKILYLVLKGTHRIGLKIIIFLLRVGMAYVSLRVNKDSTVQTVIKEVLPLLGRQVSERS